MLTRTLNQLSLMHQRALTPAQWRKPKELLDWSLAARVMLLKRRSRVMIKGYIAIGCILAMMIAGILRQIDPSHWPLWASIGLGFSAIEVAMLRILARKKIANGISGYEVYQLRKRIARKQIYRLRIAQRFIRQCTALYRHYPIEETRNAVLQFTGVQLSDRQTITIVQQLRYRYRLGAIAEYNLPGHEIQHDH